MHGWNLYWQTDTNGSKVIEDETFDLVFADAMPGKYDLFEETIGLVKVGGFYIIDDMIPQPNWPEGHADKVERFIEELEESK